ncbi:MAG: DUF1080 domain-containing protein [Candidatus Hydrogenedentes bacterium]|nr:DUF1080 domain-containing protein [Candidatus Hydrogenedentota bacterium]
MPQRSFCLALMLALLLPSTISLADPVAFIGSWELTPVDGGAGWLEVRQDDGIYAGTLLWMGGSPEPMNRVYFDGDTLHGFRIVDDEIRDSADVLVKTQQHPIFLTATLEGSRLRGMITQPSRDGANVVKAEFNGVRSDPMPAVPDLAQVELGDPIQLFNGRNLDGWIVAGGAHWGKLKDSSNADGWIPVDSDVANGWSVIDGVLTNNPAQTEGQPYIRYGNLITKTNFEDFNLTLEVKAPQDGNSGIYLRGIYEIQIRDSHGKPLDSHNMGALYGRIAPSRDVEKGAGEWQAVDITLVDRHLTVKLNGQIIIDNAPVTGCTGGALWSDESRPGPIYFQGDHTSIQYRNIVLRPVEN